MKVVSIVGARPQFVKAAAVSRKLRERHTEVLVHTGQHYDYRMSGIFFDGLDLPAPEVDLGVGSGPHGWQTAAMLAGIASLLVADRPDYVLVYGDTNSTLAGALAAAKLSIPIAHVEAGLRSFNRRMPEEVNRVIADHLSDLLLCPSKSAAGHLAAEGISRNVHVIGDVMLDVLTAARQRACEQSPAVLARLGLRPRQYLLVTTHRAENGGRLPDILRALNAVDETIVFPVHPRTRAALAGTDVALGPHVQVIDPVGYVEMLALAGSARLILTDSGGLQKEAYWLGVPCLTLRDETEWIETVEHGWNTVVGSRPDAIVAAVRGCTTPCLRPPLYGDGAAADRCIELMELHYQP